MKTILAILLLFCATAFAAESAQYLPNGIIITSGTGGTYTITVPANRDIVLTTSGTGRPMSGARVIFTGTATTYNDERLVRTDGTTGALQQSTFSISDAGVLTVSSGNAQIPNFYATSSSASFPGFSSPIDSNTGIHIANTDTNKIMFITSGTQRAGISNTGLYLGVDATPFFLAATGTGTVTFPATTGTAYVYSGTGAPPSNSVTPAAWVEISVSGTTYKLPMFQ